jgi:hypothetical protein
MASKSKDMSKAIWGVGIILGVVLLFIFGAFDGLMGKQSATVTTTSTAGGDVPIAVGCNQKPSVDIVGVDMFSSTTVTGTDYLKVKSLKPTSITTATNVGALEPLQAWTSNGSYFCNVVSDALKCGASETLQPVCYGNGTVTLTVIDESFNTITDNGGAVNLTIGTAPVSVKLRYRGQKDKSSYPFGGVLIIDYPNTISDVSVNGAGISAGTSYQVTESTISTSNVQKVFTIPAGFDANGLGDLKDMDVTFTPASNPSGTVEITMIPANEYIAKDGNFYNDVEKKADGTNTRTFTSEDHFTITVM